MEISQESISAFIKYRIKNLKRTSFSTLEEYEEHQCLDIDDIANEIKKQLPLRNKEDKVIAIAVLIDSWEELCFSFDCEKKEWGISKFIIETIESSVCPEDFEDICGIYAYLRMLTGRYSSAFWGNEFHKGKYIYVNSCYKNDPYRIKSEINLFGFHEETLYLSFEYQELIDSYAIPGMFDKILCHLLQDLSDWDGEGNCNKPLLLQKYICKEICDILNNPLTILSLDDRVWDFSAGYFKENDDNGADHTRFCIYRSLLYISPFQHIKDTEYLLKSMLDIYDDAIDDELVCYLNLVVANKVYIESYKSVFHNEHPALDQNDDIESSLRAIRKWYRLNHKEESVHTVDISNYYAYDYLERMENEEEKSEGYQLYANCFLLHSYIWNLCDEQLKKKPNTIVKFNNGEEKTYKYYYDRFYGIDFRLSWLYQDDEASHDPVEFEKQSHLLADICKEFLELIKNDNRIVLSEEQQHIIRLVTGEESLSEFKKYQKKILDVLCHPTKVAPSVHKNEGCKPLEKENAHKSYPELVPCGTKLQFPTNAALLSDRAKEIFIKRLVEELIDKGFIEVANDKIQIPEEDWYYYFGVRKEVPAEFWRGVHYKFIWKKAKQDLQHLMIKLYKKEKEEGTKVNWQAVEGVFRPQDKDRFVDLKNTSGIKKKIEENRANELIEQAFSAALGLSIESKRKPRK